MTKAELLAVLDAMAAGNGPFARDLEVASKAVGAGRAVYVRVTGGPDLPDLDAAAKPRYEVTGQGGPDRPHDEDGE